MDLMMVKNFVDVSSFFSFEATGDSEANFDDPNMVTFDYENHDNDDAESCICELSEFQSGGTDVDIDGGDGVVQSCTVDDDDAEDDDDDDDEDEDEEQGDEACSYELWSNENNNNINNNSRNGFLRDHKKSKLNASVDSNKEERMNEMEKSRLFWETCLAS